jgi:hypothetical protein
VGNHAIAIPDDVGKVLCWKPGGGSSVGLYGVFRAKEIYRERDFDAGQNKAYRASDRLDSRWQAQLPCKRFAIVLFTKKNLTYKRQFLTRSTNTFSSAYVGARTSHDILA